MRSANRFSIAVHILSLVAEFEDMCPTSEWMAESIGVNAVVVRNVTGMLRRAGLVRTQQGAPGTRIARPASEITMRDVLRAVEPAEDVFSVHANPNPNCPIGARIETALRSVYGRAEQAMLAELERTTLADVVGQMAAAGS